MMVLEISRGRAGCVHSRKAVSDRAAVSSQRCTVNCTACVAGPEHYHAVSNLMLVQGGLSFLLSFLSHAFLGLRMAGTERKGCFLCFQKPSISYFSF